MSTRRKINKFIEKYEGSVPVDGDITPITRKDIDQIDSSRWPEMTLNELLDQRTILTNRIFAAQNNTSVVTQMKRGLAALEGLIQERADVIDEEESRLI